MLILLLSLSPLLTHSHACHVKLHAAGQLSVGIILPFPKCIQLCHVVYTAGMMGVDLSAQRD